MYENETQANFSASKLALREVNEKNEPELLKEDKIFLNSVFKENSLGPRA